MGKNYRSIEWKTTVSLIFSVFLHAGLIYYVGLTQFGSSSNPKKDGNTITAIELAGIEDAPNEPSTPGIPVSSETILPEPKIEVVRPKEASHTAPKLATVLPKKATILPAPKINETSAKVIDPNLSETPVVVAKSEEENIEPSATESTVTTETTEAVSTTEKMDVQKETEQEIAAKEQLVEQVLNDAPPQQEADGNVQGTTTGGNLGETNGEAVKEALPVKNDFELKAMPGNKNPEYPTSDRLAKRQGEVRFMALVSAQGTISDIRIVKSSGHRSLDLAAYSAFKNYRYFPGQKSYVMKSFVFTLKGPEQTMPGKLAIRQKTEN